MAIAIIATMRTELRQQGKRIEEIEEKLDAHLAERPIHQESMPVREITATFDTLKDGQKLMRVQLREHVEQNLREQDHLRNELAAIRHSQTEEFKIIRETLDDFREDLRERLPRLPIQRYPEPG